MENEQLGKLDFKESINWGLSRSDYYFEFLSGCLMEVLTDLGESVIADSLRSMIDQGVESPDRPLPENGVQAVSLLLHILNLSEECAANDALVRRESDLGVDVEPGMWAQGLRRCRELGYEANELAAALAQTRVHRSFYQAPD